MRPRWMLGTLLLAGCAGASFPEMPGGALGSLARVGTQALPIGVEKEAEIGAGIAAVVAGRFRLADDPALQRYVSLVGSAVAQSSPRSDEVEFRFGVLDTDDVNAFAAPGGFIFVTRGALRLMEDEAELAGVLAHEVGHVDQKHVLEQIRRSGVISTARSESQLTGALLDQIASAGSSLLFTGLGRAEELEADSLGVLYAAAAGYDPGGLRRFLTRLGEGQSGVRGAGVQSSLAEWRASHPPVEERLDAVERQGSAAAGGGSVTAGDRFRRAVRPR
jgi:beta-barrel assembly-enhancing protease